MSNLQWQRTINSFLTSEIDIEAKLAALSTFETIQRGREDIRVFAEEMLGIPLNSFQDKFLSHTTTPRSRWGELFGTVIEDIGGFLYGRNIAFPSNQVGKTVMIAIKHLWFNYYKIGMELEADMVDKVAYQTLNISPHSRQVKQCYTYVKEILNESFVINDPVNGKRTNKLHPLMKDFLSGENSTLGELRFRNRSVFYTVPTGADQAASLAGAQFAYISYDECSQSLHLQNELGAKIMSRLIRYGVGLDLISTPEVDSPSHQYYMHICKLGLAGKEGWWALNAVFDDNKFIPKEQRERAKADLLATDKKKYRQVVFGEFITGGKNFFDMREIENLWKLGGKIAAINGRKYLIVADWGMADEGDPSVFYVFDYTDWLLGGKIKLVNHEEIKGGSPMMQFALFRTLYDAYTTNTDDGTLVKPMFVMDANSLGGVVIKKLLVDMHPKEFSIEKDEALLITKKAVSEGRDFYESEIDGSIIERNPAYGLVEAYYILELADQMSVYHIDDKKLTQDHVMTFMMGVSWIVKKIPRGQVGKKVELNPLAGYNAQVAQTRSSRQPNVI